MSDLLLRFTPYLRELARLMADGLTDAEIAERLGVSAAEVGFGVACFRGRLSDVLPYDSPRVAYVTLFRRLLEVA